jgi:hypothetical protein
MANISTILASTTFDNYIQLHRELREPKMRAYITKAQGDAITDACEHFFPNNFELRQRTPKGTVYIYVDNELQYLVDQRSTIKRAYAG